MIYDFEIKEPTLLKIINIKLNYTMFASANALEPSP